jgi:hypothetical protein
MGGEKSLLRMSIEKSSMRIIKRLVKMKAAIRRAILSPSLGW